jgi:NAD(P) transhydrogenase subunit alpha
MPGRIWCGHSKAAVLRVETGVSAEGTGGYARELTAEQGGNCELSKAGETAIHGGVKIVGPVNLPASLPYHASEMYARNLFNLLKPALIKGELAIDWNDEVFAGAVLTHDGQIKHEATRKALEG